MANSIFPDQGSAAGVIIRDAAGNCLNPPDVTNAFCPPPAFISTCEITALPNNCDARIEPRQINAIVSELLSFAACLDPDGPWDCNSQQNLCAAMTAWALLNVGVHVADAPPPLAKPRQLWWESDTGILFLLYDDGNTTQWVQVSGNDNNMDQISIIGSGSIMNPHSVALVDCGTW
jgi:hypothetical protein